MITKENLRVLMERWWTAKKSDEDKVIEEWLEENKPEPVVVGLSGSQVVRLCDDLERHGFKVQPNQVFKFLDTEVFEKPEVKEVPVGLTDEQARDLLRFYDNSQNESSKRIEMYKEWAKTQTFAQPYDLESLRIATDCHNRAAEGFKDIVSEMKQQNFAQPLEVPADTYNKLVSEMEDFEALQEEYNELDKRFAKIGEDRNFFECAARTAEVQVEKLSKMYGAALSEIEQLKSQQFIPDWLTAPDDATVVRFYLEWFKVNGSGDFIILKPTEILAQIERPTPPETKVEVGQVWKSKLDTECICNITSLGFIPDTSKPLLFDDAVSYNFKSSIYTRTLSDFLAKFERVL